MISDEKRHEVAARLRSKKPEEFTFPLDKTVFTHIFRSVFPNQMPLTNWILRVPYRLADLIDRQTCHDVGGAYEFRCSVCGCVIHIFQGDGYGDDDSAMTIGGDSLYIPHYCPNCGAEVVGND